MRKHYLLYCAAFGLLMTLPVGALVAGKGFIGLLIYGSFPILVGAGWALYIGHRLDLLLGLKTPSLVFSLICAVSIFASSALVGSIANLLIYGNLFSSTARIGNEILDWFYKPMFWVNLIGLPSSLLVGAAYFGIYRFVSRNEKSPR